MLRKSDVVRPGSNQVAADDAVFERDYPTVHAHLTQTRWEDGSVRELSSLSLYPDGQCIRGMIRDPNAGLICWFALTRLSELWQVAEAVLTDPRADWRVDRKEKGQLASRKEAPPAPNGKGVDRKKRR